MSRKNSGRARCCQETSPGLTPAKGVTNGQGGNHTYPTDPIFALIDTAAELVVLAELLVYRRLLEALRALPIPTPGRVAEFGPARDQACPSGGEWQICCYGVLNGKEAWPAPRRRPADHPF
jgi:hypothetical protein